MESMETITEFLEPTAVAIIGASETPGRVGSGLYKSIRSSFPGPVYCVNPGHKILWGAPCYASAAELPEPVSHAVIAVASNLVLPSLRQCAQAGIRSVVVVSSGFKESGAEGAFLEAEMRTFCRKQNIALLGPNTLGFINTSIPFNGSFLPAQILPGPISIISQSGGVGMALISSLRDQGCGVAKWIGIGNEAVLSAADFLEYLAQDEQTKVIAVCFEGLQDLPAFFRLARQVNQIKPVVLLRDGKSAVGMQAAASHTGTMAQSASAMEGLAEQFGLAEAKSCRECAAMCKALSLAPAAGGNRVAILTNTAGPSILAADAMDGSGICLPQPSAKLQAAIDHETGISMKLKNPADISSNGLSPKNYGVAARKLLSSGEYDVLLGFFTLNPHLILPEEELMEAVRCAGKPAVACFLASSSEFSQYNPLPESAGIPCFFDPQDAASAVTALVHRGKILRRPLKDAAPVLTASQREAVGQFLDQLALTERTLLPERSARQLLQLAGAGIVTPVLTSSAKEAAEAASRWGYPVALKLHSKKISHKSDVGGVRLNLSTEEALTTAYQEMLPAMRALDPEALLTVQPMEPDGFEVILGAVRSPGAGTLVMAGMGGIYSEVLKDTAFRMTPLPEGEAKRMLSGLRCAPILNGYRGPALDQTGICRLLVLLSDLMETFPQLQEIDLNPCRVYPDRTAVLDARITAEPLEASPGLSH